MIFTGASSKRPTNPAAGSVMLDHRTGQMLVWTGARWCSVQPNPASASGVSLSNANVVVMAAHRLEDEKRIKHWWSMARYMVGGFILGRAFVFILELVANHYFPS